MHRSDWEQMWPCSDNRRADELNFWTVLLSRPSHALYFASYEAAKDALGGNRPGHQPLAVGCAGIIATVISDACSTPFDVVKQRLQVCVVLLIKLIHLQRL